MKRALVVVPLLLLTAGLCLAQPEVRDAPPNPGPQARIAPANEPGTPLVISGTVYAPDGVTPAPGVVVYGYHTDANGYYNPEHSAQQTPRLRGWARTDANGHFEFRTIRPAAYPGRSIPAHVHWQAWSPEYPRQWFDELQFADDPLVTMAMKQQAQAKGTFANIVSLDRRADGALHCTVSLRLQKESNFK